jgi:ATP-dependent DNA helicase RecG
VNGQELLDMKDLARFADALRTDAFPGYRIGLFTGLMSREERQRVFDDFKHRRVHVLITTTVIEDGPVVQAATAMIVEQADRYDLIRLHRLRAHVARGFKQGHFLLVQSDDPDATGVERVELVSREQDGFRIAEHHLAQRGAPALLGNRADEMPSFRYVDPLEHRDLLVRARAEAFHILGVDPLLARPEYGDLRACLEESWQRWFPNQPIISARKPQGRNTRSNRRKRRR